MGAALMAAAKQSQWKDITVDKIEETDAKPDWLIVHFQSETGEPGRARVNKKALFIDQVQTGPATVRFVRSDDFFIDVRLIIARWRRPQ